MKKTYSFVSPGIQAIHQATLQLELVPINYRSVTLIFVRLGSKKFYFENISSLTSPYFRLDFTDFTLAGPITTGACTTDYFQATGAATGKMWLFVIFSMKIIFHQAPTKEPLAICLQESVVSTLDIIFMLMLAQVWSMMLL